MSKRKRKHTKPNIALAVITTLKILTNLSLLSLFMDISLLAVKSNPYDVTTLKKVIVANANEITPNPSVPNFTIKNGMMISGNT